MQRWHLFIIPVFCFFSSRAMAQIQTGHEPITFSQAQELILSSNAGLNSIQTEIKAATEGVAQAGVYPNPSAGIALDQFGVNEVEAIVEQTFEMGGKRQFRTDASKKELYGLNNSRLLALSELKAEIVRRFIPIEMTSEKLLLIDSIINIAEESKRQIERRVLAGATRQTDLIRVEIEIERLRLEKSKLESEEKQARQRFAVLGGKNSSKLLRVSGKIDNSIEVPSIVALQKTIVSSPLIKAVDITKEQLAIEKKQLKAEAVPDLNFSAGYVRNNEDRSNSAVVGLSMELPLFNRNIAAQKQLALKQQAVISSKENTIQQLLSDVQELHSRLFQIDRTISVLKTSTIPKAEQVYTITREFYSAGSTEFLDLAAAQSEMLQLRMELLEIESERAQAFADLMQITSYPIQIVK